jgi:hypothetical protein
MIRRTFWLGAGAAAGILGYRRVTAIGRQLRPAAVAKPRHTVRGVITFARDVREGMDIYMSRHPAPDALPSGSTPASSAKKNLDRKDGR